MVYHVELSLDGVLVLDEEDLDQVLTLLETHVARHGLLVHLDPVYESGDQAEDDLEPVSIDWNPFQEFEHSVS